MPQQLDNEADGTATDLPSRAAGIVSDFSEDGGGEPEPTRINGIALSTDDIVSVETDDGPQPMRFSAPALAKLAGTGPGAPLTDAHSDSARAVVGEAGSVWFDESSEAIRYRASLQDDELRTKVRGSLIDVSPRVYHNPPSDLSTDEQGTLVVREDDVGELKHLALVPRTARSGDDTRANAGPGPDPAPGPGTASVATADAGARGPGPATQATDASQSSDDVPGIVTDAQQGTDRHGEIPETAIDHDDPAIAESAPALDATPEAIALARENATAPAIVAARAADMSVAAWADAEYGLDAENYRGEPHRFRTDLADAIEGKPVATDAVRAADDGATTDMTAVERMARDAASPSDIIAANRGSGGSMVSHLRREHGLDATRYRSTEQLRSDLRAARNEGRK
jgi:hypothetical protein